MSDLRINNITDRTGDSGPVFAGVSTVTGTGAFTVPVGPTEMRGGRGRAVVVLGATPSVVDTMDYLRQQQQEMQLILVMQVLQDIKTGLVEWHLELVEFFKEELHQVLI